MPSYVLTTKSGATHNFDSVGTTPDAALTGLPNATVDNNGYVKLNDGGKDVIVASDDISSVSAV